IGVMEGSSMTRLIRRVSVLGNSEFKYRYMANTNEVARTLVAQGHGIAILPEQFVRPHEQIMPIKAVPIHESWAEREISLVQHAEATLSNTATIFRDFLLERARCRDVAR
ncbi:MAG: LysR substrate-binding domain-containing protein, partial [Roseovarius indicus]